jgi:hypothetical protein
LKIERTDGSTKTVVYKCTDPSKVDTSRSYGLAREAMLYTAVREGSGLFRQALGEYMPESQYSRGDMTTGVKHILMDDLSGQTVQSGYFFGPTSPHSWGKNLSEKMADYYTDGSAPDAAENERMLSKIILTVARLAGKLHGTYWGNTTLLEDAAAGAGAGADAGTTSTNNVTWLRNAAYYLGNNEAQWKATFAGLQRSWASTRQAIDGGTAAVKWDPALVDIISASLGKDSWEDFQADLKSGSTFTLIHGDFHPANMMIYKQHLQHDPDTLRLALFDYEMVGVGKGGQDVGQYMISHLAPAARRQHEEAFLREYYAVLTHTMSMSPLPLAPTPTPAPAPSTYTYENCLEDYVRGGSEKWVFYLVLMSGWGMSAGLMQFFHDQVLDFVQTHRVTAASVGPPRF